MKKDYEQIQAVVMQSRHRTRDIIGKFYRMLKASRRDVLQDMSQPLHAKPFIQRQISDAFDLLRVSLTR